MTHAAMTCNQRRVARKFPGWLHGWMGCALLLGLTACAQLPDTTVAVTPKKSAPLVFPPLPDEARFVYEGRIRNSLDVVTQPEAGKFSFRDFVTGESEAGAAIDRLAKPYAVAVHRGRIFVSDSIGGAVKVFDVPEGRYFTIGEDPAGRLGKPLGLDVDGSGNLYVADATAKVVMV